MSFGLPAARLDETTSANAATGTSTDDTTIVKDWPTSASYPSANPAGAKHRPVVLAS